VAECPDARTIRYYQTIGIVDKPLRYEGRNAVYGYQHLLQVVAIKLLQSRGLTLAQVQRAITNSTLSDLEAALTDELADVRVFHEPASRPIAKRAPPEQRIRSDFIANGTIPLKKEYLPAEELPREGRSRGLIAAEVAPGVSVIIDPDEVDDPEGVIARIIRLLNTLTGGLK
jgi:DNA-binding transcriptional MerR regulator